MEMSEKEFEIFRAIRHGHCLRMLFPGLHKYGPLTATAKVRRYELKLTRWNVEKCNTGQDIPENVKRSVKAGLSRLLKGGPMVSFYTNPMGHALRVDPMNMDDVWLVDHPGIAEYIKRHMHRDLGGDYILAP